MFTAFVPDLYVASIYAIDFDVLKQKGMKSVIVDLDNTLVESKRPYATAQLMEWLEHVKRMGFQVMIVSNNTKLRVSRFAKPLDMSYIHTAKKPLNKAFRKALVEFNAKPEETIVIGDQLLTDVFGGNRMGMYTILVVPVSNQDNIFTKLNRRIERRMFRWMERNNLLRRG